MTGAPFWIDLLASGLVASIVSIIFGFWFERFRFKQRTATEVIEWSDAAVVALIDVQWTCDKDMSSLGDAEYARYSLKTEQLTSRVAGESMRLRMLFAFGDGEGCRLFRELRDALMAAMKVAMETDAPAGETRFTAIDQLIDGRISPGRKALVDWLAESASLPDSWLEVDAAIKRRRLTTPPRT